ncbi:MAG: hypothetical protein R3182_06280, partial [Draconibacterium sp.]|nr:hypothetical protein [Draconibacterium sp.]
MKNLIVILALVALFSCNSQTKKSSTSTEEIESKTTYSLELLWESDTLVRTPESVLLDRNNNILYVSNINNGPWDKDGNGFISKMDKAGNVIELKWIEGLSAPKGMGISGNSFYIADISELVEADKNTGEIKNRYLVEGEPQLNDITVGKDGTVYVSG